MVLLKGHGPDGFTFYTNCDSRKGAEIAANPHAALALPLEIAAAAGPDRGPGGGGQRRRGGCLFRDPRAGFAAWRLGFGPVAPAGQPRDVRNSASKMCSGASKARTVPRPPRWGGFRVDARADRVLERPAAPAARAPRCSARRPMAGPKGCSTRDRPRDHGHAHGAERAALTTRAALASIAMAIFLIALKAWAAYRDRLDGHARLARRQRPRSARQPVVLLGRPHRRAARRYGPSLRPRQGRGAGRARPGDPDHPLRACSSAIAPCSGCWAARRPRTRSSASAFRSSRSRSRSR